MPDISVGYIVDSYNEFARNEDVVRVFKIHGIPFCIRAVTKFKWGQPIFKDKPIDDDYTIYCVYDTLEEAENFVAQIKTMEM